MKSNKVSVLFAIIALIISTLACAGGEVGLSNFRVAIDEDGNNVTSTYSSSDIFHAVADLSNGALGTTVDVKWYSVNAEGFGPNEVVAETNLVINEEGVDYVTFELSNPAPWGVGDYKVEFYLNGALAGTVSFNVQ
jgi:hypothetical protein